MTNFQPTVFPVLEDIMNLARSWVNDMFPGQNGAQGRILTDAAPFTMPYVNSAIRKVIRKLRNEGVNFPIIDGALLNNLVPVVQPDPSVFVNVSYNGYNNGTQSYPTPYLPGDCYQIYEVRARIHGSNLQFTRIMQAQEGLLSSYQNNWIGMWEIRNFALWLNGSNQAQDLMIRYMQLQPPINPPVADFETTPIYIPDSTDALAADIAIQYGSARGGNPAVLQAKQALFDDTIADIANEYIRRAQSVNYRRPSYQGGGSQGNTNTSLGTTGVVS
jgi:hypothetical protein